MGAIVPVLAAEKCCGSTSVTSSAPAGTPSVCRVAGLSTGASVCNTSAGRDIRDFLPEAALLPLHDSSPHIHTVQLQTHI